MLGGLIFVAAASSGVTFSDKTPAENGVTGNARPVISVKAALLEGELAPESVTMKVNEAEVMPSVSFSGGAYLISYTSADKLTDGEQTVSVRVYDATRQEDVGTSWVFTVDAAPKASNWVPAQNSTISVMNPEVSVYLKDTFNDLNPNSLSVKFNGEPVAAELTFKGDWEHPPYEDPVYIIQSRREGSVRFTTSNLANGVHTVEVSIADTAGNVLEETWSFIVSSPIKFKWFTPWNGSTIGNPTPVISVVAYDGEKDPEKVRMFINDSAVPPDVSVSGSNVTISHTPQEKLPNGTYQGKVEVFDNFENAYKSAQWAFTVDAFPVPSKWAPAKGSTISTKSAEISLFVRDRFNELDPASVTMKLNDQAVPASFAYDERWDYDQQIFDKKAGTVSYSALGLPDGVNTVEVGISDKLGHRMVETWSFTVSAPVKFIQFRPANGSITGNPTPAISVIAYDGEIDPETVRMFINGNAVTPGVSVSGTNVTISHTPPEKLPSGTYQVKVEVFDNIENAYKSTQWSFTLDAFPVPGPWSPAKGSTISTTSAMISLFVRDRFDELDLASVTMKLNGAEVPASFAYHEWWDYDQQIIDKRAGTVSYSAAGLPGGKNTVEVGISDKQGHRMVEAWSFHVTEPVKPFAITKPAPLKYGVETFTPEISAVVEGAKNGVSAITLKLNGQAVNHSFDLTTGRVSYTPEAALANESYHLVSLQITDGDGRTVTRTWQFYINTYPDMADGDIDSCLICHQLYGFPNSAGPFESVHGRNLDFTDGTHRSNQCGNCHLHVTVGAGCGQCHGDPSGNEYVYAPHGSTPNLKYNAINFNENFPLRIRQNRHAWDCIICHQPGSGILGSSWANPRPWRPLKHHDMPELHKSTTMGCTDCHALSLTREHAREGRKDKAGNSITCASCHDTADTLVKSAVERKDTSCEACHTFESTGAVHSEFHNVSYGAKCIECHGDNMMTEKVYHGERGCGDCHNSADPKVQNAIRYNNRSCFGCHEKPHQVYMATYRDDIPLYGQVVWGTPQSATLWSGDGWLPSELDNDAARILFSSRAHLNVANVHTFYKNGMAAAGWTLLTDSYTSGASHFELMYRKGRRYCKIWLSLGDINNPGGTNPAGHRLQVAYH